MSRTRCYVASPLGFNEAGEHYYRTVLLPALAEVVEPVDPWGVLAPAELESARQSSALRELWLRIGARNLELIRGSQLLLAWLDGQEVDSGTAVELGFAVACGLRCYGLRTDLRQAGEEGVSVNLQVEAVIVASSGTIETSLSALLSKLRTVAPATA
jgi:nucleoside 2-deoxyribosyltransferase